MSLYSIRTFALVAVPLLMASASAAQDRSSRIEITLERKAGDAWKQVDPTLVLASGDLVRFRFKSSFDGYLYVTNYGTSGNNSLLFPSAEAGQSNAVQSGKEYMVPATEAAFRISGPPGYESVYWLVSRIPLTHPMNAAPARPLVDHTASLMPRCDSSSMRARGICLDMKAGPRAVQEGEKLPENLEPMRSGASRDLTIVQQRNQSVLSGSGSSAPLLYEFRIAHK